MGDKEPPKVALQKVAQCPWERDGLKESKLP